MRLDAVEKGVRGVGAVGALLFFAVVLHGLWSGWRHPMGRTSGRAPLFVRGYGEGAWWFFLPATVVGVRLLQLLWRPIPVVLPEALRWVALAVGSLLYFPGIALMLWGRAALGEMYNVSSVLGAQLYAEHRLITSGPYAWVRNPMYVGGAMWELGALLIFRNWTTALMTTQIPDLVVRARREEEALSAQFGDGWVEYTRKVPGWIPRPPR
jgi:protein-S-isoprenylcysteine O-methyltransferase Ste14